MMKSLYEELSGTYTLGNDGMLYNKAKTESGRVPKCPPEKERAIEDALRHFQMMI